MAARIGRFFRDESGTSFEGIALSVSILAVAFVASADMLDFATKPEAPSTVAARQAAAAAIASTDLDMSPTASTNGALPQLVTRSVLDPCTGRVK